MRLKRLHINGFKNLNDFEIEFDNKDGITVLIGNNASGKSNILEAISAIFANLYNKEIKINFDYEIEYTFIENIGMGYSDNVELGVKIIRKNGKYSGYTKEIFMGNEYKKVKKKEVVPKYLPSQVIALYSGEELRLWENFYQKSYLNYNKKSLASNSYLHKLDMLYINKYYWDIALLTLYTSGFVKEYKSIVKTELTKIKLEINMELADDFRKSKPSNEVNNFIWDLLPVLASEKLVKEYNLLTSWKAAKYVNLTLDEFQDRSNFKSHQELFRLLCVAKLPKNPKHKLIKNLELVFENGTTTKDLSEGQKKQILLKLALDVLADDNSLLLFDEPDAHIHIANKKLIPELLKEYNGKRNIVLTTHSPTLVHSFDSDKLRYLNNGKIDKGYINNNELIHSLTDGIMGISEQMLFLQSDKDILIVEGKTDEMYITQALKILKKDNEKYQDLDFNFLWLGGSDSDDFNKIVNSLTPKEHQTIIAFFDRDGSGKGCIEKILNKNKLDNDFDGELKEKIYVYLYPEKDGFTESNFEVEDYFPIETLRNFFIKECSKNFQSIKKKFDKNKFAKECKEDNFNKSNFEGFKTLFDKILNIKKNT
jgi:predicted ATP-dependent endonuclease of OLD family